MSVSFVRVQPVLSCRRRGQAMWEQQRAKSLPSWDARDSKQTPATYTYGLKSGTQKAVLRVAGDWWSSAGDRWPGAGWGAVAAGGGGQVGACPAGATVRYQCGLDLGEALSVCTQTGHAPSLYGLLHGGVTHRPPIPKKPFGAQAPF